MAKRRKRQESEHTDPAAVIGGKMFRGAGAPTKSLKGRPARENGYSVPEEIIVPRTLYLRPMAPCPYGLD